MRHRQGDCHIFSSDGIGTSMAWKKWSWMGDWVVDREGSGWVGGWAGGRVGHLDHDAHEFAGLPCGGC